MKWEVGQLPVNVPGSRRRYFEKRSRVVSIPGDGQPLLILVLSFSILGGVQGGLVAAAATAGAGHGR